MNIVKTLFLIVSLIASNIGMASSITGDASDFTLKSRAGKNIKLSEYRGDVIMVNFWASWCGPCRQEMPALEHLYKKYQDLGFVILGVNLDEDSSKAAGLLTKIPVSFPILYDNTNKVAKQYDVKAMPTTFLIDRNGKLRYVHIAYKPGYEAKYEREIKTLVRE